MADRKLALLFFRPFFVAEGESARQDGTPRDHCPYPEQTEERELWLEGWSEGRDAPDCR
jgi:ribosome modulation factor